MMDGNGLLLRETSTTCNLSGLESSNVVKCVSTTFALVAKHASQRLEQFRPSDDIKSSI